MKPSTLIAVLLIMFNTGYGQSYYESDANTKHFFGVGYSFAKTNWYSRTENFDLFNKAGQTLMEGDGTIRAKSNSQMVQMEVLAPVGKVRLGMGIGFEQYELYVLTLKNDHIDMRVPFTELFRFDKCFGQMEIPLKIPSSEEVHMSINMKAGYYGFTRVSSLSLFGKKRSGKTIFGGIGFLTDLKLGRFTYLYLMPFLEYKYFKNSRQESPNHIYHNLISLSAQVGLRFHLL